MSGNDELFAWVTLARVPRLGVEVLSSALELLGGAAEVVHASSMARRAAGLSVTACAYLDSTAAAPSRLERRWFDGADHHLIPFNDPRFPNPLREASGCPVALYVAGKISPLSQAQIAVVGSRNPSPQGRATAAAFAEVLASSGLGITSGLAEGIDSAAHMGALRAEGTTLAVLGNGLDLVYPRCNAYLSDRIRRSGALISEFAPGTPPRRSHFPRRNRIIAGLSLGTLVVEAARRSGSLITARLANERGRDVFAVPGSIYNPLSRGCHELIRCGAKLVETPQDILGELNHPAVWGPIFDDAAAPVAAPPSAGGMDKDRKILLDALGFDPADLDVLVVRTGLKPEAVSSMMLILELEGHVQAAPGGRYSRVANRRAGGER